MSRARNLAFGATVVALFATAMTVADPRVALAQPARVQVPDSAPPDYAAQSRAWNGLATFVALCRGLGLEVETTTAFHWNEIEPGDILVVIYPTGSIPGSELAAFVRGGGRLVIADDFGVAGGLFARLGILRERLRDPRLRFGNLGYAPIATASAPDHPLAEGISRVITNHPAALISGDNQTPLFSFGGDQSAVIAATFGRGRFVALADPSILINRMLELSDNLQFAVNLIRYLASDTTQRVVIVSGDFSAYGDPEPLAIGDPATLAADRANGFLYEMGDYLLTSAGARWAAIAGALCLAAIAAMTLPLRRRPVPDSSFTRVSRRTLDFTYASLMTDGKRPRLIVPAAIIRDSVNAHLATVTQVGDPLAELSDGALLAAVNERIGDNALHALAQILPLLRRIPPRAEAESNPQRRLSMRDFDRLHHGATAFYRSIDPHRPRTETQDGSQA